MASKQDLVVIGGGAGGLVVASVAAQVGLKTTLIEKTGLLGGDCLHTGCVPSKTLIHLAHTAHVARTGVQDGLLSGATQVNFGAVIDRVQAVIAKIQLHDDPERFRSYGCDVRFGSAQFLNPRQVSVAGEIITGKRFVIATGSHPAIPPIPGLEEAGYDTNESIFTRRELPARLVIIGAGAIGVELAQAFVRLGSKVSVVEMATRILPLEDAQAAAVLQEVLEAEGVTVVTAAGVTSVRRDGDSRQLLLADNSTLECDRILVATGRRPSLDGLGLETAGVDVARGGITVDRRLRSSQRHIYAVGDVCGPYQFTHMAEYQAGIALANIVFRIPRKTDYRVWPRVVFTDPEVAQVGLTEAAAQERNISYHVTQFPVAEVDRAITEGAQHGFAKILVGSRGRIIGASLIGPHAGELIHELALAMSVNARAKTIAGLVHAYPTHAQIHRRAVNKQYAHLLQSGKVRFLAKLMNRLLP